MSSEQHGQFASPHDLIEAGRKLHGGVKSLEGRLKRMRTALDDVQLTDSERDALSQGTVPPVTPDVQKFLALRGEYSDALAELEELRARQYELIAQALGFSYPHYWTAQDVAEWCNLNDRHPQLDGRLVTDLVECEKVASEPFRRRVRQMLDAGVIPDAIGKTILSALRRYEAEHPDQPPIGSSYFRSDCDWHAVEVLVGLAPAKEDRPHRIFIPYELADVLRKALRLDPHQAGV